MGYDWSKEAINEYAQAIGELRRIIRKVDGARGTAVTKNDPWSLVLDSQGSVFNTLVSSPKKPRFYVVDSVIEAQGGRYNLKIINRETKADASGDLVESDIGEAGNDAIGWNLKEVDGTSHNVNVGTYGYGYLIGATEGTNSKPIIAMESAIVVSYGTCDSDWVDESNTITVTPCESATDNTSTGESPVDVTLFSPEATAPHGLSLSAGDIIAFIRTGDDTGIAFPVAKGIRLSACIDDGEGGIEDGTVITDAIALGNGFTVSANIAGGYTVNPNFKGFGQDEVDKSQHISVDDDTTDSSCGGKRVDWLGFRGGKSGYGISGSTDTPPIAWEADLSRELVFANSQTANHITGTVAFAIENKADARGISNGYGKIMVVSGTVWTLSVQGESPVTSLVFDSSDADTGCPSNVVAITWTKDFSGGSLHLKPTGTLPKLVKEVTKGTPTTTSTTITLPISIKWSNCDTDTVINLVFALTEIPNITSWTLECDGEGTGGTLTPNYGTPFKVVTGVS